MSSLIGFRLPDNEGDVSPVHGRVFSRLVQLKVDDVAQEECVRLDGPVLAVIPRLLIEKNHLIQFQYDFFGQIRPPISTAYVYRFRDW